VVVTGAGEGAGVARVDMVVGMITKEGMVGINTKVGMDIKVDTKEDITTKLVMGVMVMTKVDT
jgi:hypothetical protein